MKTLADFDFSFQPSVERDQLESLYTLSFIELRENVVFLGPPGAWGRRTWRSVSPSPQPKAAAASTTRPWPT